MGADSSKPERPSDYIFKAQGPVQFSQRAIDGLQNNPESDRTRARDIELHIQQRVHAELQRLETEQSQRLSDLSSLVQEADSTHSAKDDKATGGKTDGGSGLAAKIANVLGAGEDQSGTKDLDRAGVQREIDELRAKLQQRKLKEEVVNDARVEKARTGVIECLRLHDRRPLDCWREVEEFRSEVARLEKQFLGKVLE